MRSNITRNVEVNSVMREQLVDVPVAAGSTQGIVRMPEGKGPFPLVVHGPGWMSTKDAAHYMRYHSEFASNGIASLVTDYRTFGPDVTVIDPPSMVDDLIAALRYGSSLDWADRDRVVIMGTGGMGAGAAVIAGAREAAARAVVAVSPFAEGQRWLSFMRTAEQMDALLSKVDSDKRARECGEPGGTIVPVGGITIPPAERAQIGFKASIQDKLPAVVAIESVERILAFRPVDSVAAIGPRELVIVACRNDVAVPFEDAAVLRDRATGPCRLVVLEDTNSYRMHEKNWQQIASEVVELVGRLDSDLPHNPRGVEGND